jgi:hypothetical protein
MPAKIIPIEEWLDTFRAAADELARTSLRFDPQPAPARADASGEPGAYIAILSEHNAVHLGISAPPAECRALARALLGIRHDEPLTDQDAVDGLSEVMNILAGKVKASMSGRDGQLRLGLPLYVQDPIRGGHGAEAVTVETKLGPVDCTLRVYRRKRAA